jgi:uncharacterized membrane protein YdjX (TVP38/TMEM64 family)
VPDPSPSPDSPPPPKESLSHILKRLGPASLLAAVAAFLPPLGSIVLFWNINAVGTWLREHASGVGFYVAGFALLAGLAFLPTYASAILGGWAFGFATGFPAAMGGFLGGSLVGYGVARPTASERVEKLIADHPKWKAVRDALVGGTALKTLAIVTLLRIPPNSPFAVTNLVLASVRVPLWIYSLGTIVGMAPRTAAVVLLASKLQNMAAQNAAEQAAKQQPWWVFALGIAITIAVLGILGMIANHAIKRATTPPASSPAP